MIAVIISRPELRGDLGAVSSTHHLASSTGMAVLERGGNAFDAAVGAAFVLQVVEPHYNGLGGDVSIVLRCTSTDRILEICGQGPMPQAATLEHFRGLGLTQIPGSGLLPATVPGAFGAWLRLLAEFGTMSLADVMEYAIGFAERGFPILPETARAIAVLAPLFTSEWRGSAQTFLPDGSPPRAGSRFRNLALARTYQLILAHARTASNSREGQIEAATQAFYRGFVADAIDHFTREAEAIDATGRRHRALLTGQDLADWSTAAEPATTLEYGEYLVGKAGPWSQGPVYLQQLALLSGFDLHELGFNSAEYVHTVVECSKLAFADREAWYGDPRQSHVPMSTLLSPEYTALRRELIGKDAADGLRPGAPDGRAPWLPTAPADAVPLDAEAWMTQLGSGLPSILQATAARGDTCCVSVTDRWGNIVAATPSGGWLKSSPAIPELGFPLGTRGQTMWLVDGHPNSVAPGRRPRTTLSPTVVLRDGEACLAFGTPGGDRQDQWTLLFFLAAVEFGLDSQAAVEALAFHSDAAPASFTPRESRPRGVTIESDCPETAVSELRQRGHDVALAPAMSLGKVCVTGFSAENGFVFAAASPRGRQAYAACR